MGVMKSPEAAKAMAIKKGVEDTPVKCDSDIAIGNIIETAAALVISAVSKVVTINSEVMIGITPKLWM